MKDICSLFGGVLKICNEAIEYGYEYADVTVGRSSSYYSSLNDDTILSRVYEIAIGSDIQYIGDSAFDNFCNLRTVKIPNGVEKIGSFAFYGNYSLIEVDIPSSVTNIGECAFWGCSSLGDGSAVVRVDDCLVNVGYSWSNNGNNKISQYRIQEGVRLIADGTFRSCDFLTSVVFSDSLEIVGNNAFAGCSKLENVGPLDSVKVIGGSAFKNCVGLTSINMAEGLQSIGGSAFENCGLLTTIEIPSSVETIGESAFKNCGLESICIPEKVTSIGTDAFAGCCLKNIVIAAENQQFKLVDGQILNLSNSTFVYAPKVEVLVLSTSVRENDPTILDVKYIVKGVIDRVHTRALAFEDGTRSWANVVRPETFVTTPAGTPSVIGDNVGVNVTNVFSWKVSSDYENNLAKLNVEVFVKTDDLLPMEFMTIPSYDGKPAVEFSRNTLTEANVMNALYWLYADNDAGLTLSDGILKNGTNVLAYGDGMYQPYRGSCRQNAADYVIKKMGYERLTKDNYLDYVNNQTRLSLSPSEIRQYAVREVK